jgi:hypothetical protein
MTQQSFIARRLAPVFALALAAILLAGCDFPPHRGKSAHEEQGPIQVTPNAVNKAPENLNEVTITVKDGKFVQDQIILQVQGASIVHIANQDSTAYRFQLLPDLVNPTPIGANGTTTVEFTTTSAGNFTGQLLPRQGTNVLSTINVRVQTAGGVNPP